MSSHLTVLLKNDDFAKSPSTVSTLHCNHEDHPELNKTSSFNGAGEEARRKRIKSLSAALGQAFVCIFVHLELLTLVVWLMNIYELIKKQAVRLTFYLLKSRIFYHTT